MLSIRGRLFLMLLKNRHLLQFKSRKETAQDWLNGLDEVRKTAAKSAKMFGKIPKDLEAIPGDINGKAAEWILPKGYSGRKTILYFRGGGYVLGSIEAHRGIVAKFVRKTGVRAFLFEYSLAPENPYPAALMDAVTAYNYLLDQGLSARDIVFAGDSAGGGLCLATMLYLKDKGIPLPSAAATLSAWTDLQCIGNSYTENRLRCLSPQDSWISCRTHYATGKDLSDPYISPLYGDLHGLPPLYLSAGEDETLRDDSIAFAHKAEAAGVDVTLNVGERMCHCYPACAPIFPEATTELKRICEFLTSAFDTGISPVTDFSQNHD